MLLDPAAAHLLEERYGISEGTACYRVTGNRFADIDLRVPKLLARETCASDTCARWGDGEFLRTKLACLTESPFHLSFDLFRFIDNLRFERYCFDDASSTRFFDAKRSALNLYYRLLRPVLGVPLRKHLQKFYLRGWRKLTFPNWPVDTTVENLFERLLVLSMKAKNIESRPFIWFWPRGYSSCAIMTHDVETATGLRACDQLMDLDESFGIRASFQLIPEERYAVPAEVVSRIWRRGFEVNVQDLNHDGLLFSSHKKFLNRVRRINGYGRLFGALGFRAGGLYRNPAWYDALEFSYDMSIPNVAHLDPQRGGCCTVFPFFIGDIVELPVTTTQDYSLFHILNHKTIRIWKEQISIIRRNHGLMSFIVHPDYITDKEPRCKYIQLLQQLSDLSSEGATWIALPQEVASWWRLRRTLRLVKEGQSWKIEGEGSERAMLAHAEFHEGKLIYVVGQGGATVDAERTPLKNLR